MAPSTEGAELVQWIGMKLTFSALILPLFFLGTAYAAPPAVRTGAVPPTAVVTAPIVAAPIRSYREWKADRIQTATSQIAALKARLVGLPIRSPLTENIKKEIDQQQWNLDVAKDLSVTDYFVIYLSQVHDADRFKQAAARMSLAEIEEMMKAYSETVAPVPSDNLQQGAKLPVQAGEIREWK
jgi:hypothetical protein